MEWNYPHFCTFVYTGECDDNLLCVGYTWHTFRCGDFLLGFLVRILRWAENMARIEEMRSAYKILVVKPEETTWETKT